MSTEDGKLIGDLNGLLLVDAMWAISDRAGGTEIVGEQ